MSNTGGYRDSWDCYCWNRNKLWRGKHNFPPIDVVELDAVGTVLEDKKLLRAGMNWCFPEKTLLEGFHNESVADGDECPLLGNVDCDTVLEEVDAAGVGPLAEDRRPGSNRPRAA